MWEQTRWWKNLQNIDWNKTGMSGVSVSPAEVAQIYEKTTFKDTYYI